MKTKTTKNSKTRTRKSTKSIKKNLTYDVAFLSYDHDFNCWEVADNVNNLCLKSAQEALSSFNYSYKLIVPSHIQQMKGPTVLLP